MTRFFFERVHNIVEQVEYAVFKSLCVVTFKKQDQSETDYAPQRGIFLGK